LRRDRNGATNAVARRRVDGIVAATDAERKAIVAGMAREAEEAEDPALRHEREGVLNDREALMDAHAQLAPRYADIRFRQELTIIGSRRAMQLLEVGSVHTESDVVGWLADDGVLFSGDIVQVKNHPAIRCGGPVEWDAAIGMVASLGARVVVSGHGPVAGGEVVDLTRRYFAQVPAMTTEELLPEPFKSWRARDVWRQNLRYLGSLGRPDGE
ncbi:MAG: MBL fold metallo-hydrolase, partial [Thermaerobacter sp.]|nr:MBL fold metallo-hydrolase [Thermaerobacter sp.]